MPQEVIRFCEVCETFHHITAFVGNSKICEKAHPLLLRSQEGWVDPNDGTMRDEQFSEYMMEPILRARSGKTRERVETALKPYFHRRPVTRKAPR